MPGPGGIAGLFDSASVSFYPWGTTGLSGEEPVSPHTRFPIASVTKPFTAQLLLEALHEHAVPLTTPLRTLLPHFALSDPVAAREITLEDALCHRSGLPPHTWAWIYSDVSRTEFIRERLPHLDSVGPHRDHHRYSNMLYAVLGEVVETLTGVSWEQALREQILKPLGMDHTGRLTETWATQTPVPARPHDATGAPIPPFFAKANHLIAPASEMISTAADLARWGQHLLRHPPSDDRWTSRNAVPDMDRTGYGLGWRIDTRPGPRRIWHSGQCSGYSALLVLYPGEKRGGVYLCNRAGAVPALHALDEGCHPQALPARPAAPSPVLFPAKDLATPEGRFHHPGYGDLTLSRPNGIPHLAFQSAPAAPLLRHPNGLPGFQPPGYRAWIPASIDADRVHLSFEPQRPPIRFVRA